MKNLFKMIFIINVLFSSVFSLINANTKLDDELWKELYQPSYKKPTVLNKNNILRKQLFEQFRLIIFNKYNIKVKFQGNIVVYKNWAFFNGNSYDSNNNIVKYPEFSNSEICVLWLHAHNGWIIVDYNVGFSDMFWIEWINKYGAPKEILDFYKFSPSSYDIEK